MGMRIGTITIFVDDHDLAKDWYTDKLGMVVLMDNQFGEGQRWLSLGFPEQKGLQVTLVLVSSPEYKARLGSHVHDHVFLVIETDDIQRDFESMKQKGVTFFGEPTSVPWGKEVVFEDLYGNRMDLLELKHG